MRFLHFFAPLKSSSIYLKQRTVFFFEQAQNVGRRLVYRLLFCYFECLRVSHPVGSLALATLKSLDSPKSLKLSGAFVWRPQSRYTESRIECRITFPQNQRCRAKIALHSPQIKVYQAVLEGVAFMGVQVLGRKGSFAARKRGPKNRKNEVKIRPPLCRPLKHSMSVVPFSGPPVALPCLTRSRQGAREGCRGGLVEGIAALLGSENGSRYRRVSQLQSRKSRYAVQLSSQVFLSEWTFHKRDLFQKRLIPKETYSSPCRSSPVYFSL